VTPAKTPNMTVPPTPSIIRKILPLAAFFVAFAIVMTALILYMDNTGSTDYKYVNDAITRNLQQCDIISFEST
jgi:hypothetical protein